MIISAKQEEPPTTTALSPLSYNLAHTNTANIKLNNFSLIEINTLNWNEMYQLKWDNMIETKGIQIKLCFLGGKITSIRGVKSPKSMGNQGTRFLRKVFKVRKGETKSLTLYSISLKYTSFLVIIQEKHQIYQENVNTFLIFCKIPCYHYDIYISQFNA
jgi:hypothetical protein